MARCVCVQGETTEDINGPGRGRLPLGLCPGKGEEATKKKKNEKGGGEEEEVYGGESVRETAG